MTQEKLPHRKELCLQSERLHIKLQSPFLCIYKICPLDSITSRYQYAESLSILFWVV